MPSQHPSSPFAPAAPARDRLVGPDVVRGLAVCGILLANIATLLKVFVPWTDMQPPLTAVVQGVLVNERFFPIFSFLFGIGFALMVGSAARRTSSPRRVMVQRFAALADAGWHRRAERSAVPGLVLAGVGAMVAIPMTLWQLSMPDQAGFSPVSSVAGLATAAVYIGLTLALLHTPLRHALVAFFAPLGRTALTSYVSASLVGAGVGAALFSTLVMNGGPDGLCSGPGTGIAAGAGGRGCAGPGRS